MNLRNYSQPVHRSLIHRNLIFGIPAVGMMILLIIAVFTMYILQQYYFGFVIFALFITMRIMTKKDPYLVDILVTHVNQKDMLIP